MHRSTADVDALAEAGEMGCQEVGVLLPSQLRAANSIRTAADATPLRLTRLSSVP
jgi:hypothetical protein